MTDSNDKVMLIKSKDGGDGRFFLILSLTMLVFSTIIIGVLIWGAHKLSKLDGYEDMVGKKIMYMGREMVVYSMQHDGLILIYTDNEGVVRRTFARKELFND